MRPKRRRTYGEGSITKLANGKWLGRLEAGYTATGARRRISVVAPTEAECKRRLRDKRLELEREGPGAVTTKRPTVKAWSETWLTEHERRVRPKTYATDASVVRKWIVPNIGHRKLADLNPHDVRKVLDAVRAAGLTSTTAGYVHAVLRRTLKAAIMEGHRIAEPVMLVPKPAPAVSDRDAMSLEDAVRVLAAAQTVPAGVRWWCALIQGMRQGEALGLTWDAVDLERGTVDVSWQLQALPYADEKRGRFRVPDGYDARPLVGAYHLVRPKTEKGHRVIPLLPVMVDQLAAWQKVAPPSPHGLVFPRLTDSPRIKAGGPLNAKDDREMWHHVQDIAGVKHPNGRPWLVHEIRHTCATFLLAAGVDEGVIKSILGHSSIVTTRGYQHTDLDSRRAALQRAWVDVLGPSPALIGADPA